MCESPRILVCRSDGPGGVAHYYRVLAMHFPSRVTFFIVHDPDEKRVLMKFFKLFARFPAFMQQILKADVVCLNPSLYPKSYYRDMLLLCIVRLLGRKVVVFFRGWSLSFGDVIATRSMQRLIFRFTYARAHGLIVLGETFAKKLVGMGIPRGNIFIETTVAESLPGCEPPETRYFDIARKSLRLLFLSRIVDGKGWRQTIDFTQLLRECLPDWEVGLTMAGDGQSSQNAQAYAEKIGLNCHFPGRVQGKAKFTLYAQSEVFIMHSETEGLPNNILEAMAYGLFVVSTPVGAIPEIVEDAKNGILIQSGVEDAVERLVGMLNRRGVIQTVMNRNMQIARARFLPQQCAVRYMDIMDKVAMEKLDG